MGASCELVGNDRVQFRSTVDDGYQLLRRWTARYRPSSSCIQNFRRLTSHEGLTANQMAFGYALTGNRDESRRALDEAMGWFARPARESDMLLGQRSVVDEDLFAIFQATCDVYLGRGASVIRVLEPRLVPLSRSSARTATITRATLACAYAHAGQPAEACRLVWETLHAIEHVDSLSARSQLRRTVRVLDQWRGRSDVQDLTHRLGGRTPVT
jgi:hypothetical protein